MQRIELDFIGRSARLRWGPRVLLAAALGLAGDMAVSYVQLTREVRSNEAIVARAKPHQSVPAGSAEEVALARDAVQRLGLPWTKLFAALEAAGSRSSPTRRAARSRSPAKARTISRRSATC